jgi:hypothetical protein
MGMAGNAQTPFPSVTQAAARARKSGTEYTESVSPNAAYFPRREHFPEKILPGISCPVGRKGKV